MKKRIRPVKLPPLLVSGSISRARSGRKLSFNLKYIPGEHQKKLRSRSKEDRARAAATLANMARSRNCLTDSLDALRILGQAARAKNLEAAKAMVEELGQTAYQESLKSTARANNILTHSSTIILATASSLAIYSGNPLLVIPGLSLLTVSAGASILSITKEGSPINMVKMSQARARKILESTNK